MQISKAFFTFIIIFVVLISAAVGFLANELIVNQERAELNAEVVELEQEIERLELQMQAQEALEEEDSDTHN